MGYTATENIGDKWQATLGSNTTLQAGASVNAFLGFQYQLVIAASMAANLGLTLQATLGASYTYFKGAKKDYCADSTSSISNEDYVLGAGKNLCLAGGIEVPKGHKTLDRNTVINLTEKYLDLVAGDKKSIANNSGPWDSVPTTVMIIAAILTGAAAASLVVTTSFIGQQKNDNSTGVWAPPVYQGFTAGLCALNLAVSIAVALMLKKNNETEFKPILHKPEEIWSTISLQAEKGNVVVGARDTVWIDAKKVLIRTFDGTDKLKAILSIDDSGNITVQSSGDLKVMSSKGLQIQAAQKLELAGQSVEISGAIKMNSQDYQAPPGKIKPVIPLKPNIKPQYKS